MRGRVSPGNFEADTIYVLAGRTRTWLIQDLSGWNIGAGRRTTPHSKMQGNFDNSSSPGLKPETKGIKRERAIIETLIF